MARDGSGTFTLADGPFVNGTIADATEMMNILNDIADALTDSPNIAGTKAFAADQSMGGFKLTNLAAPASANDAARKAYVDAAIVAAAQPLDATLTALAALSWSSGSPVVQFTAADTVSLTLTPSLTDLTLSGLLKAANGSASAPSYTFTNDTNTGMFGDGSDGLRFTTGGTQRLTLTTSLLSSTLLGRWPDGTEGAPAYSFSGDTDVGFYRIGSDNMGLSLGGTKRADFSTSIFDYSVPMRARTAASSETTGTLTSASANKSIQATGNITVDGNVFAAGDMIAIYAGASARTLTQGSTGSPTQRLHGSSTTGNLTISARGMAAIFFISATEWVVCGDVS